MLYPEEKIAKYLKITFLFLIILLGATLTSESFMIMMILAYMAFVK